MPLLSEAELKSRVPLQKSVTESKRDLQRGAIKSLESDQEFDIFLSHSYQDAKVVEGLKDLLEDYDFSVFVDWIEAPQLDRTKVTPETADYLRKAMDRSKCLLYASSYNSSGSLWMPWELGYSDAKHGRVAVVPLTSQPTNREDYNGPEYLGLYPYVSQENNGFHFLELWVKDSAYTWVRLSNWLLGENPRIAS